MTKFIFGWTIHNIVKTIKACEKCWQYGAKRDQANRKVLTLSPAVIKEMCLSGSLTLDAFALETEWLFGFEDRNESLSVCRLGRGGMLWYSETLLPSVCLVYSRATEMAHCLGWDDSRCYRASDWVLV